MTDFNHMRLQCVDTWRDNLTKRLIDVLPKDTVVEFIAYSQPRTGTIRRILRIHLGDRRIDINLKFPESLDQVMDRVVEAIK